MEVDIFLAEQTQFSAAGIVLHLQDAELSSLFRRTAQEFDHHSAESDFNPLDGCKFLVALDGAGASVVQFHEIGVEGVSGKIHSYKFALLFEFDSVDPLGRRYNFRTASRLHVDVVAEE